MFSKKVLVFFQLNNCCDYNKLLERSVECCVAGNCLEILRNHVVDLVILDCDVETDFTIDQLKSIKQIHPDIPVIIVTNFVSEDFVIKAYKNGVRDIFKKPLDGKELRKTVDTILWLRQESFEKRNALLSINRKDDRERLQFADNLPENIVRALVYIDNNLVSPLILDEIAREAYMSKFHFSRIFKKYVGITPMRYAINMRLKKAMSLLQQKNMSISCVAAESGFNDLSEFNKQFKKLYGSSPSTFREAIKTKS